MHQPLPTGFRVDATNSDDQHLYLDHPGKGFTLAIKLDDEGVVVDLYPLQVADQPLVTLACEYVEIDQANGPPDGCSECGSEADANDPCGVCGRGVLEWMDDFITPGRPTMRAKEDA